MKAISAKSRAGLALTRGLGGLPEPGFRPRRQGRVSQTGTERKGNPSRRKVMVQSPGVINGRMVCLGDVRAKEGKPGEASS